MAQVLKIEEGIKSIFLSITFETMSIVFANLYLPLMRLLNNDYSLLLAFEIHS